MGDRAFAGCPSPVPQALAGRSERDARVPLYPGVRCPSARTYVPDLDVSDVVRAPAGVRAQAVDPDGSLVDDFRISQFGAVTAVRNAPSPAATSALAIAEYVLTSAL